MWSEIYEAKHNAYWRGFRHALYGILLADAIVVIVVIAVDKL